MPVGRDLLSDLRAPAHHGLPLRGGRGHRRRRHQCRRQRVRASPQNRRRAEVMLPRGPEHPARLAQGPVPLLHPIQGTNMHMPSQHPLSCRNPFNPPFCTHCFPAAVSMRGDPVSERRRVELRGHDRVHARLHGRLHRRARRRAPDTAEATGNIKHTQPTHTHTHTNTATQQHGLPMRPVDRPARKFICRLDPNPNLPLLTYLSASACLLPILFSYVCLCV